MSSSEHWEDFKDWAVDNTALKKLLAKILAFEGERRHSWFFKLIARYLDGGGDFKFESVPTEWRVAILQNWRKRGSIRWDVMRKHPMKYPPGKYHIKPYNWGVNDIRQGAGHFDLTVIKKKDEVLYVIEDTYDMPYYDSMDGQLKDMGIGDVEIPDDQAALLIKLLPSKEYIVPEGSAKGTRQTFRVIRKGKDKYDLLVPTRWLRDNGTPFRWKGTFSSKFDVKELVENFDEGWAMVNLDEDDLAHDLTFLTEERQLLKVFNYLKKNHSTESDNVAREYVMAMERAGKMTELKKKATLVSALLEILEGGLVTPADKTCADKLR